MSQIGQFGIRGGQASETVGASFEARLRRGRRSGAERHRPRGVRRDQDAEDDRPVAAISPSNGAEYPRSAVRAGAAADRAARQGGRRPRGRVRRRRRLGHPRQPGRRRRDSSPTRLDDFARGIAALVTDLGDRMATRSC